MTTALLVPHNGMGHGPPDLQRILFSKYISLTADHTPLPAAICFYTDGVKLVVQGTPAVELLKALAAKGVKLIVCKTCLDHYGLADKVVVGTIAGMPEIVDAQAAADKVITV